MLLEFTEIQKRHAEESREWGKKWEAYFNRTRFSQDYFTTTMPLVTATAGIGYVIADELEDANLKLERIAKSVSDKKQYPSLKEQLQKEKRLFLEVKHKLNSLKSQKTDLQNSLSSHADKIKKKNPSEYDNTNLKMQQKSRENQLKQLEKQIKSAEEDYAEAKQNYHIQTKFFVKQSENNELARLQSFTDPLQKFIGTLKIEDEAFSEALQNYNPDKDLIKWREKINPSQLESNQ